MLNVLQWKVSGASMLSPEQSAKTAAHIPARPLPSDVPWVSILKIHPFPYIYLQPLCMVSIKLCT